MTLRRLIAVAVVIVGVAPAARAQDARDFSAGSARVSRAPQGTPLTGPSAAARPDIVSAFLRSRHDARTVQSV